MNTKKLQQKAKLTRGKMLKTAINTGQAHLGGGLSSVEILLTLYNGGVLKKEDKFIFSKGHCPLALYTILEDNKIIKNNSLTKYGTLEMPGHADHQTKGVEITTGSLGYGLGIATGYALSKELDKKKGKVYCLLGDTECTEGSIWEAIMFASSMNLNNLVAIVDDNKLGVLGATNRYASVNSMIEKWKGFGWDIYEIDGHDFTEIFKCFKAIEKYEHDRPIVIIAHTIKGKGISFMENNPAWHHGIPRGKELKQACKELGVKI